MKQFIQKIIDDTLKTPKGKWSRTSLTMMICLFAALSYLTAEFLHNNKFYIEAFYALLATATGMKYLGNEDKHKMAEINNDGH